MLFCTTFCTNFCAVFRSDSVHSIPFPEDYACKDTHIVATEITEIKCSEVYACATTSDPWEIECGEGDYNGDEVDSCDMLCTGYGACSGDLDTGKDVHGQNSSEYRVVNIDKLDCSGTRSCANGIFGLRAPLCRDDDQDTTQSEEDGCHVDVDCSAEEACRNAVIQAEYPKTHTCSDESACAFTVMQYYNPHPDFKLDCNGIYYFCPLESDWK